MVGSSTMVGLLLCGEVVASSEGVSLSACTSLVLESDISLSLSSPPSISLSSVFLGNIKEAFDKNPNLQNLLLDDFFKKEILKCQDSWRKVVAEAVTLGIPTPAFSTALAFFDGYR